MAVSTKRQVEEEIEEDLPVDLRHYDAKNLLCRDLRHAWEIKGRYTDEYGWIRRVLQCMRCKSVGTDYLSRDGARMKPRTYQYRDGYLIGKVDLAEVRVQVNRRETKAFRSEKQMMDALFNGNGRRRPATREGHGNGNGRRH